MKLTYLFTAVVNSAIILSLPLTLRLYDLSDEAISLAFVLTVIHDGFAMLLWPSAFTLSNALRAANDVRYTMIVSVSSMIVFRVGLSLVFALGLGYGAIGVFAAMVVDWVFRTVLFVVRYRRENGGGGTARHNERLRQNMPAKFTKRSKKGLQNIKKRDIIKCPSEKAVLCGSVRTLWRILFIYVNTIRRNKPNGHA